MKFLLACHVTVSAYTVVEADTLEQAFKEAKTREVVIDGAYSGTQYTHWVIDDADGSAENIHEVT